MDKLRKKIILWFIAIAFSISVVESIEDEIFDVIIFPYTDRETVAYSIAITAYVVISFALFALGSYIYYLIISKAIKSESNRQIKERNQVYVDITHDLNTPMTSTLGYAAALKEGKISDDELQDTYDIIYRKSSYMKGLVEQLFSFAKLDGGNLKLEYKEVNICRLLRDLLAMNYDTFEDKGIELNIDIPDDEIILKLDEGQMKRAINNILVNTAKYNLDNARVMVSLKTVHKGVIILVADDGKDISSEEEKHIYNPFIRGDAARTGEGGNGLGLAISKTIVEAHGGKISIDRNISGYTKGFKVTL